VTSFVLSHSLLFRYKRNTNPHEKVIDILCNANNPFIASSLKMPATNNLAFTAPINPAGATPVLSLDQIWSGLLLKIQSAETFVPAAIQSTKVVDDYVDPTTGNAVTVREVTFRETQKTVQETVTAFEACRVEFAQPDGSRVSNVISQGADGELFMTYIFEWRHPGASKEELAELLEKEKKMSQMAVEGTIKVLRRLVEEKKL
jgi:hypothetical protein